MELKYRDIEYAVVQGIGGNIWKWSLAFEDIKIGGQAKTKAEAMKDAERAIDRKLAPKKLRIVRPD
jgi:hypothetical protein